MSAVKSGFKRDCSQQSISTTSQTSERKSCAVRSEFALSTGYHGTLSFFAFSCYTPCVSHCAFLNSASSIMHLSARWSNRNPMSASMGFLLSRYRFFRSGRSDERQERLEVLHVFVRRSECRVFCVSRACADLDDQKIRMCGLHVRNIARLVIHKDMPPCRGGKA
mgnify:CR=1 FL=1